MSSISPIGVEKSDHGWGNDGGLRPMSPFPVTYYGVVVALQANIWFVNTSAVAVFVAAALRRTVIPDESKVALASSRRHASPVHTALGTDWLTLTRSAVSDRNKEI